MMARVGMAYVNKGLAYVYQGAIYLHEDLQHYPGLEARVIEHELEHIKGNHGVDLKDGFDAELWEFVLCRPSTWISFLPVWIHGREIIYDPFLLKNWCIGILCVSGVIAAWILW